MGQFYFFPWGTIASSRQKRVSNLESDTYSGCNLQQMPLKLTQTLLSSNGLSFVIVFITSLNVFLISDILNAKNAQQKRKTNTTDSSACVCPLGCERRVNRGKNEKQARIKKFCLQWLCNYNGSWYISHNMVGWRCLGGARMVLYNRFTEILRVNILTHARFSFCPTDLRCSAHFDGFL